MSDFLYKEEAFALQGAIFEVYRTLGCGFLEAVYQKALEVEFTQRNIPFTSQKEIEVEYKGIKLEQSYRVDFICFEKIILELKAVQNLLPEHEAQLQNYLRATKMRVGLLVNFGHSPKVEIKRIAI
jgi:GxxExxY protein